MSTIDIVTGGAGGSGKSLIAAMLAEFYQQEARETLFLASEAARMSLLFEQCRILPLDENATSFQAMIDAILPHTGKAVAGVIDCAGKDTTLFLRYMAHGDFIANMSAQGFKVRFHLAHVGGERQALSEDFISKLAADARPQSLFVWDNHCDAKVSFAHAHGYAGVENKLGALLQLPPREAMFGNLTRAIKQRVALASIAKEGNFYLLDRQRLVQYWRGLRGDMQACGL